jgi:hypothetical protein
MLSRNGSRRRGREVKVAYTDLIFHSPKGDECGLADAKAMSYYNLPSPDYAKMLSNYSANYREIAKPGQTLGACTYVAGGLSSTFDSEAMKLTRESKVPCNGVRARDLLEISRKKNSPETNWSLFKKSGQIQP